MSDENGVKRRSMLDNRASPGAFLVPVALLAVGCAPLAMLRPASALMGDRGNELGLGAVAVSPRQFVDERWLQSGQLWFIRRATPWLNLSAISAFDAEAVTIGGAATVLVVRADRFAGGVEAGLGYGWAEAGTSISIRLFEQTWLYGAPRLSNIGSHPAFAFPAGLSLQIAEAAFARLEYQSSWERFLPNNQRNHLAAAFAVQW